MGRANYEDTFLNSIIKSAESWTYSYIVETKALLSLQKNNRILSFKKAHQSREDIKVMLTVVHREFSSTRSNEQSLLFEVL